MRKEIRNIILALAFMGICILSLLQINQTRLDYILGELFLYFVFIIVFIYMVYRVIVNKPKIQGLQRLKPLLFGTILILGFFLKSYLIETDGGKTRLIAAGANHDPSFVNFDLFTNGTFRYHNSGPFGGSIYRGKYTLVNDTLKIDNPNLKDIYPTLTFVLKETKTKQFLFEPCDTNKVKINLYINEDYRK
jgi:energy-coupling factor transporter transmembrane protein EcfT